MFVAAIRQANLYARPLQILTRYFGSRDINRLAATFFAVNADGWALTCKHVVELMLDEGRINDRYAGYRAEFARVKANKSERRKVEKKFGYHRAELVELRTQMAGLGTGRFEIQARLHPHFDVALVRFPPFADISSFPRFATCDGPVPPGTMLCRLGYPLPTFTNFAFNATNDQIEWLQGADCITDAFPLEGMVTREIRNEEGFPFGYELSTPGIVGHSGGPVFDAEGTVWGMQYATGHLDMGFGVKVGDAQQRAILHVGQCIQPFVLTEFMAAVGVQFAS